jgi:hypothetical protein
MVALIPLIWQQEKPESSDDLEVLVNSVLAISWGALKAGNQ